MNRKNTFIIRQSDGNLKVPEARNTGFTNQFIRKNLYHTLEKISSYRFARNIIAKQIERRVYSSMVSKDSPHLRKIQLKKFYFLKALLESSLKNMDKGYFSFDSFKRLLKVFTGRLLTYFRFYK